MLVANVSQRDVPVEIQVVGTVEAYSTISLKAQMAGRGKPKSNGKVEHA